MLNDAELNEVTARVQRSSEVHNHSYNEVVKCYDKLVSEYNSLKSCLEKELESRKRPVPPPKEPERNPFVLVLIDGSGYHFGGDLVRDRGNGGERAAQLLGNAVRANLRSRNLDDCDIMVRVYADLTARSEATSITRSPEHGKERLAAFAAGFTRSKELFDFVDIDETRHSICPKIGAMIRLFAGNTQCRHIFAAVCHDSRYVSYLKPYERDPDRITLVRNSATRSEFTSLGFRVEGLSGIFDHSTSTSSLSLGLPLIANMSGMSNAEALKTLLPGSTPSSPSPKEPTICAYDLKGRCKWGINCRNIHSKPKNIRNAQIPQIEKVRPKVSIPAVAGDVASRHQIKDDMAARLPGCGLIPKRLIAVNKNGDRLDAYMPQRPDEVWASIKARIARKKLCNQHHLVGKCSKLPCAYDHAPITADERECLKSLAQRKPCIQGGDCRALSCHYGHICQSPTCKYRGGDEFCHFSPAQHKVDLQCAGYMNSEESDPKHFTSELVQGEASKIMVDEHSRVTTAASDDVDRIHTGGGSLAQGRRTEDPDFSLLDLDD